MCLFCDFVAKISAAPKRIKDKKLAETLIDFGVHFKDCRGWTTLYHAIQRNLPEVVEKLLKNGANPNVRANGRVALLFDKTIEAQTPFELAVNLNRVEILRLFLKQYEFKPVPLSFDILKCMLFSDNFEIAKILLDHGLIDPNSSKQVALMSYAILHGKHQWIKLLLEHGYEVDKVDKYGHTGLHLALMCGNNKIIQLFLEDEANPNQLMPGGYLYPLTIALTKQNGEGTDLLTKFGASLKLRNISGNTVFEEVLKSRSLNQMKQVLFLTQK